MNNGKVDIIIRESELTTQYKTLVSKILRHPCLGRLWGCRTQGQSFLNNKFCIIIKKLTQCFPIHLKIANTFDRWIFRWDGLMK